MSSMKRKLPVGIQSFEKLREEQCVYVDKTAYIYRLVHDVVPFFLSRPRRFGKSLLLSTLKAYWEGKKELFEGLQIEQLEKDNPEAWKPHPVFYFDFNGKNYKDDSALEDMLSAHLARWEEQYQLNIKDKPLEERFQTLLITAYQKTGLRCVVLIDEYDKPLLDLIDNPKLQEHNKAVFKGFFSNLKNCDEYLRFVFITGVTKFHKVSIFSDLNQLNDISLNEEFSEICGITEEELKKYFLPEVTAISQKQKIDETTCLEMLKTKYDGYHFFVDSVGVYNPFSLLKAFYERRFGSYWFETGTPTFLVNSLKSNHFDVRKFTNKTIYANDSVLQDYTGDTLSPIPLLYQSGYLTIESYNARLGRYTLCFPNEEVKYGFLNSMMPAYVPTAVAGNGMDIYTLEDYIEEGNLDDIKNVLTALFANITYTASDAVFEHYFQTVIYLVFTLLGKFTICEMHTFTGRIDCKVETERFIYLFEFKRDESADKALQQIEDKSYNLSFVADHRKLYKIGVSFDSEKRILSDWKVKE
ncbi:MAG: AAA family ATPase [Oscillospiraceae bacterium]